MMPSPITVHTARDARWFSDTIGAGEIVTRVSAVQRKYRATRTTRFQYRAVGSRKQRSHLMTAN